MSTDAPAKSFSQPRHLMSIADLQASELTQLVKNVSEWQQWWHQRMKRRRYLGNANEVEALKACHDYLKGCTIAMLFNKRSTRTRVSTESAAAFLGATPMFLGKDDIQLGVNESIKDTAQVISRMVQALVVRTGAHSGLEELAKESFVPVINALTDDHHPLQAITDISTMFAIKARRDSKFKQSSSNIDGMKLAWVGDANNVLFDLAIAGVKMGVDVHVATPAGYEIPAAMLEKINGSDDTIRQRGSLQQTNVPEEAVKDADVIVTDTWISMGQEAEKEKRLKDFAGFQVTEELAKRGGARSDWAFMHCLPRHAEEVSDEVFYHPSRSVVYLEAQKRLFTMLAVLEAFIVKKGVIPNTFAHRPHVIHRQSSDQQPRQEG